MKSTFVRGLFILIPLLIVFLLVSEVFQLLVAIATPLADLIIPKDMLDSIREEVLLAMILLLTFSLLVGLLANSPLGKRWGKGIERKTLGRLAMYRAVKRLTEGFIGSDLEKAFQPGLLNTGPGEQDLVYVIEDHGNGKLTIMLPKAPTAFSGPIKVVDINRVEFVDSNIAEYSKVLGNWGVGLPGILRKDHR